ncbi:atp-binding protein [Amylolactobacillus amylotrophicus DSM 20534]|uniref:Atp-binding protein n=5 Tax=Amylolactobacillus TaxID=2767876 RepID=A0A0R1YJY4_9LACO|nr:MULTISPECIES: hypothetical protein [Amylolactobacillus]KRK38557.1 atp-binding protein [Amylolactobacillus amylotrophicus DSM 20534]KRM42800.1 atp-binding protein [Amylolactobacillus amylophilus DSM 20533 = JCM 1125]GED79663.1 carboxylate--amine ligase [Amylolactobacillus amylophilus]
MKSNFIPVIVGTDINTYNMAISFHQEYGIKPILVGSAPLPFTRLSSIPEAIEYFPKLHDETEFAHILLRVAQKYQRTGKKLLLVGTSDIYVRNIILNAEFLKKYYVFNYPSAAIMDQLQNKKSFYELCDTLQIEHPNTIFVGRNETPEQFDDSKLQYPLIIKPSNVVAYFDMHFAGKEKVYRVKTRDQVLGVIKLLRNAGYDDELIIQEFIPGDDTNMWDGVLYVNSNHKTELVALGQVVLQEHTPTAIGNLVAIITRNNLPLMKQMQEILEKIGYTGFANFDIKYDKRDQKFKIFEINIRQGRSSYYVTQTGHNMAKYLVEDCVAQRELPIEYNQSEYLFSIVPKMVLRHFVFNPTVKKDIRRLIRQKKWGNPLFYSADRSLKRSSYLFARQVNYVKKYSQNKW